MNLHRLITGFALGCAAVTALAQDRSAPLVAETTTAKSLEGPLAGLPEAMFDIECRVTSLDGGALGAACWDPSKGPVVSVNTIPVGRDLSFEELVERMRATFRTAGSLQVVEEKSFAIGTAPGAATMRGEYRTELAGRKFTWSASYRGNLTRVVLTVPDSATWVKRDDLEGEVMTKVFGPDRYVPEASAAP